MLDYQRVSVCFNINVTPPLVIFHPLIVLCPNLQSMNESDLWILEDSSAIFGAFECTSFGCCFLLSFIFAFENSNCQG
jgi:hypothetical protein